MFLVQKPVFAGETHVLGKCLAIYKILSKPNTSAHSSLKRGDHAV